MNAIALVLLASGAPLGPAGIPQTEPFPITQEYKADYAAAQECDLRPDGVDAVKEGEKAIYVVTGTKVEVFLDEFARRYAMDYCWQ